MLPAFAEVRLDAITFDTVERYVATKLAEGALSAASINKTVRGLAAILETAVEGDLIARNPAKGKGRRARERAPRRTYLDTADQIAALLDAAGKLDARAQAHARHVHRRAIVATLVFSGLRIGECCALRWRDVDLAGGRLTVGESKTDAGRRKVTIRGALRDELLRIRPLDVDPDGYVFETSTGGKPSRHNTRSRVLAPAVALASSTLVEAGRVPLPDGLTPRSLRRTFASVLYALGESPPVVMRQMGHTSPELALRIYAQVMDREGGEVEALRALVDGGEVAVIGIPGARVDLEAHGQDAG